MKLWLDDERPAPKRWVWAKTADEAIHHLTSFRKLLAGPKPGTTIALCPEVYEITYMSFDHDLADVHYDYWHAGQTLPQDHPARARARETAAREQTGYDVLLWMAEHNVWPTEACYVHTHNSARANAMCGVINRYGPYDKPVRWTPYAA